MDLRLVTLTIFLAMASGRPHEKLCPVSRYLSMSSADMRILRQLQHDHEKAMSPNALKCHKRMLRHKPSVCDLGPPTDRLMLTLEQVSLVVDVLTDMSTSALWNPVTEALMVFLKLKDDLMTCRESMEYGEPASPQLKTWLEHFQRFQEAASSNCVREAVILSLIQLRVEDVGCWALTQ